MHKYSTYFTGHNTTVILIEEIPDFAELLMDLKILENYIKIACTNTSSEVLL